jgi:hypothetical protein
MSLRGGVVLCSSSYSIGGDENARLTSSFSQAVCEDSYFFSSYRMLPILAFRKGGVGQEPQPAVVRFIRKENITNLR